MFTFAIGDIHGCLKQLEELMVKIQEWKVHNLTRNKEYELTYVFIGDYIDRGLDSKGVIDYIRNLAKIENVIALKGNHEEMMIETLRPEMYPSFWLSNGGRATLDSFGVSDIQEIPDHYIEWINGLHYYYDDGRRFFVHAGVDRQPLAQTPKDVMIWIRDEFMKQTRDWGRLIVHGHTPTYGTPEVKPNRVNLDTGCVFGHRLTCAVFDDEQDGPLELIQVEGYKKYVT